MKLRNAVRLYDGMTAEKLDISRYMTNDNIALIAYNGERPDMETSAVLTVNIAPLDDDRVILDSNRTFNVNEVAEDLQKAGILGERIGTAWSGYCKYPIYEFLVPKETIEAEMEANLNGR